MVMMVKIRLDEPTYLDVEVVAPFRGVLPLPVEYNDQAFVVVSFHFPKMRETYGRSIVVQGTYADVDIPITRRAGYDPRILLVRAILVPPNGEIELRVKGSDGQHVPVVLRGLFSRDVA